MSIGPGPGAASGAAAELEGVRREYEQSLSWRVTRPLRALGRAVRSRRDHHVRRVAPGVPDGGRYDEWLEGLHGPRLSALDAACAGAGPEAFARFRHLDADLWALLLTQEYAVFPHIRALLPSVPDPALQELWNGASGVRLAAQSTAFYTKLRERHARHGERPLEEARVLDFGCGWGRLTRYLARDVAPGSLHGCDPAHWALDVCRETRVPAVLARSEFMPRELPFAGPFDLAFAFSVFTHLSEAAADAALDALHAGLRPGGLLVVTVRPPAYLRSCAGLREPRHVFVPHPAEPSHPQYGGGEMHYGEAVVTLPYVRERWAPRFELVEVDVLIGDLHQVVLTLRRG
jgi:SAM-dependent methyltransferase